MASLILMPALSPTMTEGTIARWLRQPGDVVKSGDVIAEIETDKATMEVEAVDDGVFGKVLVPEGSESVAVNTPIAVLLEDGEDAAAAENMTRSADPVVGASVAVETPSAPAIVEAPAIKQADDEKDWG
ncbi:MAG: biotin/lipoyl-containing protein, partial [Gluconobacter cerinus]